MFKVNDVYIDHLITISLNLDSGAIEKLGTAKAVPAAEVWFHAAFFVSYGDSKTLNHATGAILVIVIMCFNLVA